MGALAHRLSAPEEKPCKYARLVRGLDTEDRAALEEWERKWGAERQGKHGVHVQFSAQRLHRHLEAAKLIVAMTSIKRHFEHACSCYGRTDG